MPQTMWKVCQRRRNKIFWKCFIIEVLKRKRPIFKKRCVSNICKISGFEWPTSSQGHFRALPTNDNMEDNFCNKVGKTTLHGFMWTHCMPGLCQPCFFQAKRVSYVIAVWQQNETELKARKLLYSVGKTRRYPKSPYDMTLGTALSFRCRWNWTMD